MSEGITLPNVNVTEGVRRGRNVRDGYVRGWGLEFGDLREQIARDPLYRKCSSISRGRTIQAEDNRMNVFLIIRYFLPQLESVGHIVEYGAFRGGSSLFMAAVAREVLPDTRVYSFDTFEGMPQTDKDIDAHTKGQFSGVDFDELQRYAKSQGLDNLHFVKGMFEDTATDALAKDVQRVALCHIDCDIRSALEFSYEVTKPYMVKGGYWVFDDPLYSSCLGATEAVEELIIQRDGMHSEQIFPHYVFREGLS